MKPWKRAEYYLAKIIGGRRVALSGGPGAPIRCDIITARYAVEVSTETRRWRMKWEQVCDVAQKEGKVPVLLLKYEKRWLAIMPATEFGRLIRGGMSHVAED